MTGRNICSEECREDPLGELQGVERLRWNVTGDGGGFPYSFLLPTTLTTTTPFLHLAPTSSQTATSGGATGLQVSTLHYLQLTPSLATLASCSGDRHVTSTAPRIENATRRRQRDTKTRRGAR